MQTNLPPEYAGLKRPKPAISTAANLFFLLLGIPWSLASLYGLIFLTGSSLNNYLTYNRLLNEGVTVTGTVTNLSMDKSDASTSYRVSYRFQVPVKGDPVNFDATNNVSEPVYKQLETNDNIEVIYVQSDPGISSAKVARGAPPSIGTLLLVPLLPTLFLVIGVLLFLIGFQAVRRFFVLRSRGASTQAIVFDRWETSNTENSSYFIAFAYRVPDNEKVFTYAEANTHAFNKLKIGDRVAFTYLPENPEICKLASY